MTDANDFILRSSQVQNLEAGVPAAMLFTPKTNLSAAVNVSTSTNGSSSSNTTASCASNSTSAAGIFTVGDVVGAAVGAGAPLLLALIGAIFVILSQQRKLKRQGVRETAPPENNASQYSQAPAAYAEPVQRSQWAPRLQDQAPFYSPQGYGQASYQDKSGGYHELTNAASVNEMPNDRPRMELDGHQIK
ncbi:hypothetical protein BAUCODRAFT_494277 [Baudoinia panamericana UAMH 10762]|uniref:Mid2 domain-containing protein n=1 Tax=Baudoinia panamericana (strain UAMH 10762) TaxID=717646 RepID=M2MVJ9_BAUPA|nr:uncharacterized protein BAUCODRAFT_494277 [Baudoinia panamericana UAMH 10762]EMC95578.1 hypothetical protein BAUCODRAFT_494277 [Baudoinia panamericana UAMH 10762]